MSEASQDGKTYEHFYACLLFSISLIFLFLFSTLYHSFFMLPNVMIIFQKADHCGIYMLIAGSYTPFLMLGLHEYWEAQVMCIVLWILFFCGTVFSIASDLNNSLTGTVELCFYLGMGLSVLGVWPQVCASLDPDALFFLILGGVVYVGGVVFFKLGDRWPVLHAVWHLCVLIASFSHWISIYRYVLHVDLGSKGLGLSELLLADINDPI